MDFDELQKIISETLVCDISEVTMEAALTDDLGADSLSAVELVMNIEEKTGITIPDDVMATFATVGDIVNYLAEHQE